MRTQTPATILDTPEHWRQRAEEARKIADLMTDIPSKEAMLRIAADYEDLAKRGNKRARPAHT